MPKFTAIREDHTFVDLQGVTIHWYSWMPGRPKAIVLIVHGVGDHALRYEHVAQRFVAAGYGVAALDQRGHGATGVEQWSGDLSRLGRLGPGGLRAVDGDVVGLLKRLRGEHEGLPIGVIGHSWGSLTMQRILNTPHAGLVDAVMLSGTALRLPGTMNGGDLNARHRHLGETGHEWLSRDPAVAQSFADDPLAFDARVMRLFGPIESARLIGVPHRMQHDVPLLIAIGSDDPLGGAASVRRLAAMYESRAGLTDVTVTVYPGARHEIFNEITKATVLDETVAWFDEHLEGAPDTPSVP